MSTYQSHVQAFEKLRHQIREVENQTDPKAERIKRSLWAELDEIDESIQKNENNYPEEFLKLFSNEYPSLIKSLSLNKHAPNLGVFLYIVGYMRLIGVLIATVLMFPVFVIALPLRWLHPILRKAGVKNNKLPYDYIPYIWANWALFILGIEVSLEGWEHMKNFYDQGLPTIGLFEHSSFTDFIVVMAKGGVSFKWIGKKSVFFIPMLGQMAHFAGMIPIDRKNRDAAKKSLDHAAKVVQHYKRSIAISPEGTRSNSGHLAKFKKGAFHLCLSCKCPATPILMFGTYHCWPPQHKVPTGGHVVLRFLPQIDVMEFVPNKYQELLDHSRRIMMEGMKLSPQVDHQSTSFLFKLQSLSVFALTYSILCYSLYSIFF